MTYKFKREPESGLIIVSTEIDGKYELKMVFDTGATNTTIDSNALYLLGYDLKDNIGKVEIETANGVIETEVFEVGIFSSLGLNKISVALKNGSYCFVVQSCVANAPSRRDS
jgi:predicted aspartyl protease